MVLVSTGALQTGKAQTSFYDIDTIQQIEIWFNEPNWDYMMDTAKVGAEGYAMAAWVRINGVQFDSVGVKYKGNSSYDSSELKNPLHINLKKFKTQKYQGISEIKLSNCYQDPSMIREPLAYAILANYMHCPRSNFAQVYINGTLVGLYSNDEDIDKPFLKDHFFNYASSENVFFKCSHASPSPLTKCNLKYLGSDSSLYQSLYELESNYGWNDLVKLCDTVTNYPARIGYYLDMDRVIWMLAFNNVLVNMDSYSGLFAQNYYLYKDNTNVFNPVMWDLNMAFGGFPFAGSQGGGTGSLTVTGMQQLSTSLHGSDADWPLIGAVMSDPMYQRMYMAHVRTITNEMFAGNAYQTLATQMQGIVDTAVQSDPNKGFTYAQFQNGLTANTPVGSYTVPGISNLMAARVSYLQGTTEFNLTAPLISTPVSSVSGNAGTFTAQVTGSLKVYLGYRFDTTGHFTRIEMFDDGNHEDGAAGDNNYGISIGMDSTYGQYYIYAEDADAGMFSPQRAEHEYYRFGSITDINDLNTGKANGISVYPNPASASVTVVCPGAISEKLIIRNLMGQTVYEQAGTQRINTELLPPGHYFIQCGAASARLVVRH